MSPDAALSAQGAFANSVISGGSYGAVGASGPGDLVIKFDASKSNAIYGASHTVQPLALCFNYVIKA